jgi:hypothetical protein
MNPPDSTPEAPVPSPASAPEAPDDFKAMMIGAAFIFVTTFIPFSALTCCLPIVLGVLLAIHVFTNSYRVTLSYGDGIKFGILTAMLGAYSAWIVALGLLQFAHYQVGQEVMDLIVKFLSKSGNQDAINKMNEAMEQQRAQGITLGKLGIGLVTNAVWCAICGTMGGALGAALFKRGPKKQAGE